jgi:urease accessory protein
VAGEEIVRMRIPSSAAAVVWLLAVTSHPAAAHHVMSGKLPTTFMQGMLSGLGHPIIGLDHLAAIVAVGCLAAMHRTGAALATCFVLAMLAGVAMHLRQITLPASEILVALSVIALGSTLILRRSLVPSGVLALFAIAGLLHGHALGESIVGAEPAPLYAYLFGLAMVQTAVALGVMTLVRMLGQPAGNELAAVRLVGAGIIGIGLAALVAQIVPGA